MPQASILDLERPSLDRPRRPLPHLPSTGKREHKANAVAPVAGPGRLYLIERCGGELGLTSAEQEALAGANIIVYERSLAALVAAVLPLGAYAEPAPEAGQAQTGQAQTGQALTGQAQTGQAQTGQAQNRPVFERCLKFALDGWSVVQLMERRPAAERARWTRDAAEQLVSAGVPMETPVRVLVDAACGGPVSIETQLGSAHAVIDDRRLPSGGVTMVLGPIAAGPAPQVYAFAANGLAG